MLLPIKKIVIAINLIFMVMILSIIHLYDHIQNKEEMGIQK